MSETARRSARPKARTILIALLAGFVVLLLLFPASGVDSDPPVCRSMFFYVVPCGNSVALVAAALTVVVVGMALWMVDRRHQPS